MPELTDARIERQLAYLRSVLPVPPARVLDAGCGRGDLALALHSRGYDVTGIDIDPDAVAAARSAGAPVTEADMTSYDDQPFDAVLFSVSLHHVADLDATIGRARDLVVPGGVLIADEFAWERADDLTATWFHDTAALLSLAGLLGEREFGLVDDPLDWWVRRHRDDDPMHPGAAMAEAIARRFTDVELHSVPYLHRHLAGWLTDDSRGARMFTLLRDLEGRRIAQSRLAPVGLQMTARRP